MQKLSRREALRGTGVAALAIGAAAIPAVALAAEAPSTETLVRNLVRELLTGDTSALTAGEWIERKRIAVVLQVMIGDEPEPWAPWEISDLGNRAVTRPWARVRS
jgi:hypothetical protein